MAIERPNIDQDANTRIRRFLNGDRDKQTVPNVGHLVVMLLISDIDASNEDMTGAIIKEAVTRNVVWMLDGRGSGMAELSYMAPSAESDYRLQKTFEAGKTSYCLLMFLSLMGKTVNDNLGASSIDINSLSITTTTRTPPERRRDALFARHGAPPPGAAAQLAECARRIQQVDTFPKFLKAMGISTLPNKQEFTKFTRRAVNDSMDRGFSRWAFVAAGGGDFETAARGWGDGGGARRLGGRSI